MEPPTNAPDAPAADVRTTARPSAPALDYAIHRRHRRRWIIRIIALFLMVSAAGAVYRYRHPIWSRVLRTYWTWRCLHHVIPPDTVLLEWELTKVAKLLKTDPDYVSAPYVRPVVLPMIPRIAPVAPGRQASAEYVPRALRELHQFTPTSPSSPLPNLTTGVVFLGQRRSPSGNARLVIIYGSIQNALTLDDPATIPHEVYTAASLFTDTPSPPVTSYNATAQPTRVETALLSAGVPDPDDATRVTIGFSITSRGQGRPWPRGTIDVYLQDDDTLKFTVHQPPRTATPLTP